MNTGLSRVKAAMLAIPTISKSVCEMLTVDLPRSALIIIDHLKTTGPMSPKQISSQSKLPSRTVSFALRKLMTQQLCRKVPNLMDMRQPTYYLNDERITDLRQHIIRLKVEMGIHLKSF